MADYSKNFTKISESILSSDNEEGEAMTSQKVKGLNDEQIYNLLCRIDTGYSVTEAEKTMLSSVIHISWHRENTRLPNSIRMLTSLAVLDLSGTKVRNISALSKLTSLSKLNLNDTEVSEISALSKLTSLSTLYLSGTQVSEISALSKLTSLSELCLSGTQVSDISALSKLTSLSELDLSNTKVSDISALSKLTSLSKLDLSGTEVTDISALSKLTSLSELCLSSTEVSDISALSNLTLLSDLCLGNTQLKVTNEGYKISLSVLFKYYTSFATFSSSSGKIFMVKRYKYGTQIRDISALSKLTSLLRLDLEGTKVNDISALSNLKNLETLNLGGLEINDLDAISGLTALKQLNLQNSKTTRIPESILDLDIGFIIEEINPFPKSHDKGVFIHGLTLTDQPIEVFSQSRELLRAYYTERNRGPVNECKVIFLGDAESGKTHSIRRLLKKGEYLKDEDFDGNSTPGIETTVSKIKMKNTNIVVNYWDFDGQEIQHSMHRMFLTERTVYVVFLNARQDDQMDERARYWLENIKTFAPDAPVLVVINKIDENNHPRFNEIGITSDYSDQVKKVIRLSAKEDTPQVFLEKLQESINNTILELPTVKKEIPGTWKNLMEDIRSMPEHYLTTRQFIDKCSSCKIMDFEEIHDDLVDLFQVIGVSFCYYKDRSTADYMLLNPKWMLNALYTIVTNGKKVSENGIISHNDLFNLLKNDSINGEPIKRVIPELRYQGTEVNYILGVIRTFKLSYRLEDGSEFFPMLCDGNEKKSVADVPEDALHFIFRYKYLPTNVIHRLIVNMQGDIDYQKVWYTGAVFRNEQQNQIAYVHALGNDLHIYVYGEHEYYSLNEYLTPISNRVRRINKNMGISAKELMTYRVNDIEAEMPFDEVMGNLRNKLYTRYDSNTKSVIDYRDISRRYIDERPRFDRILQSIIKALEALQRDKTYYRNEYNSRDLENSRNHFVSAQLESAGYNCSEQLPGGFGKHEKAAGERDIVIRDILGQEILIYEGLNLAGWNKTYIDEHIAKLLKNYNPNGLRKGVLVTYLECDRDKYLGFINGYRMHMTEYAPEGFKYVGEPIDMPSNGQLLTVLGMNYEAGGLFYLVYHIIVRVAP